MEEINVKLVSRVKTDGKSPVAVNNRLRQLATKGVKQYGWDRTDLHIRSLNDNRVEISLCARLIPTPLARRTK